MNEQQIVCVCVCVCVCVFNIGLPGGSDGKEICLQCRRPKFSP